MPCLGILPYSNCPHYASQRRRSYYSRYLLDGTIKPGYAADDFATLHFVNEKLVRSVASEPYAKTWYVDIKDNKVSQTRLNTTWLGIKKYQQELIWSSETFSSLNEQEPEANLLIEEFVLKEENTAIVKVS
jgi:hypothetical protein